MDQKELQFRKDIGGENFVKMLTECHVLENMVTIEGADLTGTTTLSKRVVNAYNISLDNDIVDIYNFTCEPKYKDAIDRVHELFASEASISEITPELIDIFISDRMKHQDWIKKFSNQIFVSDRSSLSTIIYQGLLHETKLDTPNFASQVSQKHIDNNILIPKIIFLLGWEENDSYSMEDKNNPSRIELIRRLDIRLKEKNITKDRFDDIEKSIYLNRLYKSITLGVKQKHTITNNNYGETIHIIQLDSLDNLNRLSAEVRYYMYEIIHKTK